MSNVSELKLDDLWPLMKEQIDSGKAVEFRPSGSSMLPLIQPIKDVVLIKKAPSKLKKFDLPLYRRKDGAFVLHRVVGMKNGTYTMRGDNQKVLEYGIEPEQILAIAVGVFKNGVYTPFSGAKYFIYCRFRNFRQKLSHLKSVLIKPPKKV